MKVKIITGLIAGVLLLATFKLVQKSPQQNSDSLIIGTASGYAPFVSTNPHGELEGFDIDVATALAQQLGKKLVIKDLGSMTSLLMALDQGKIDAALWALSITQERLEKVAMVRYQGELTDAYPLIFWQQIPEEINSIDDMQGRTVCVEPSSAQSTVLNKYTYINQIPTEKVDDALLNIQYGKADAAFVEPAIAQKFKNKYPEIQILDVPLAPEDRVQGMGIAIKKTNKSLINDIQEAINNLREQRVIRALEEKWGIS